MFSFISDYFDTRRRVKTSQMVIKSFLNPSVLTYLEKKNSYGGITKIPLYLCDVGYEKYSRLYIVKIGVAFSDQNFFFAFKLDFCNDDPLEFTIFNVQNQDIKVPSPERASAWILGNFLYSSVIHSVLAALHEELSHNNKTIPAIPIGADADTQHQFETQLIKTYFNSTLPI